MTVAERHPKVPRPWAAAIKFVSAVLGAGLFYSGWMAVFLLVGAPAGSLVRLVLWLLSPGITAVGFAIGASTGQRLTGLETSVWREHFGWALGGCVLGAAVVVYYGPMLIVFGMLATGTAGLVLLELLRALKDRKAARLENDFPLNN